MATHDVRTQERDRLARFLGWFSIGLGTVQVVAPRALCRLVGAEGIGHAPFVIRVTGVRELVQGGGILTRTRPTGWLWSRVAGDALDLAALGVVAARSRQPRTAFAIANVALVAVPHVFEAVHLTKREGEPQPGKPIRRAVTINRPRREVEQAWDLEYEATFAEAPGRRGTEVRVEFRHDPRAGEFGAVVEKLTGRDRATRLADDLRRFKQRMETGEVVRSDATSGGHRLAAHLTQRPAVPA